MHSLGIVQWNFTRRDHPGNPGGVSGSGPVSSHCHKRHLGVCRILTGGCFRCGSLEHLKA